MEFDLVLSVAFVFDPLALQECHLGTTVALHRKQKFSGSVVQEVLRVKSLVSHAMVDSFVLSLTVLTAIHCAIWMAHASCQGCCSASVVELVRSCCAMPGWLQSTGQRPRADTDPTHQHSGRAPVEAAELPHRSTDLLPSSRHPCWMWMLLLTMSQSR